MDLVDLFIRMKEFGAGTDDSELAKANLYENPCLVPMLP